MRSQGASTWASGWTQTTVVMSHSFPSKALMSSTSTAVQVRAWVCHPKKREGPCGVSTESLSLSLSASSGLAPHLYLSPQPFPSFLSLLPSFPSIPASDTYSLASEYFLFLFSRVRLVGEAFPGLLPALPEVKCRCRTGFCQPSSNFTSQPLLGTHCAPGPSHELSHSIRARTLWGRVTICTGHMSGPVLGAVQ